MTESFLILSEAEVDALERCSSNEHPCTTLYIKLKRRSDFKTCIVENVTYKSIADLLHIEYQHGYPDEWVQLTRKQCIGVLDKLRSVGLVKNLNANAKKPRAMRLFLPIAFCRLQEVGQLSGSCRADPPKAQPSSHHSQSQDYPKGNYPLSVGQVSGTLENPLVGHNISSISNNSKEEDDDGCANDQKNICLYKTLQLTSNGEILGLTPELKASWAESYPLFENLDHVLIQLGKKFARSGARIRNVKNYIERCLENEHKALLNGGPSNGTLEQRPNQVPANQERCPAIPKPVGEQAGGGGHGSQPEPEPKRDSRYDQIQAIMRRNRGVH